MLLSMNAYAASVSASASAEKSGASTYLDHDMQILPLQYKKFEIGTLLDLIGMLMVV
jgi:hypothetical protein